MARQPRLVAAGYPHHVILRGNNKNAIFIDDKDRRFFIDCLKEAKEKTKSKIYAYCLMTNHVHMLVEPSTSNGLSKMIQSLGRKYVQHFNYRHNRTGTLWEGRYKSSLISKDGYLLACSRYIELNPVTANIVTNPADYHWSSFRFKTENYVDILMDEDSVFKEFGDSLEWNRLNYKKWFFESISQEELNLFKNNSRKDEIIGNKNFVEEICNLLGKNIIPRPKGRPPKMGSESIFRKNRL